jgi:hypothetical protein
VSHETQNKRSLPASLRWIDSSELVDRVNSMTTKVKGSVWLPLLVVALGVCAVGFAFTAVIRRSPTTSATLEKQNVSDVSKASHKEYVSRGILAPRLTRNLSALGNRLEKPGKERLTVTGVLRLTADSQPRQVAAILEFPERLRLVVQNGPQSRLITFDGEKTKGQAGVDELDLIETLAYDSAEHFFAAQLQGRATRFLGSRFRTDDGSTAGYGGPYFDIYKIAVR